MRFSKRWGRLTNGKPYHGSDEISDGQLEGATGETDYFYFFCPKCPDREVMRILEYGEHARGGLVSNLDL